ncbi:MAG: hypothetical protein ABI200_00420 [Gaiellales bacterium]
MLHNQEQIGAASVGPTGRALLTGDLGVIVVRSLVELGVGYVVSSWRDRPTPIDAAIDDSRERLLSPRGVVLRRLRSLAALEPIITAPTGGVTGAPPRGAVIFAGRHGLRPVLEQYLSVASSGAVVGFTFDEDAARIEDGIVIDPEPTAIGLVRAIDAAYAASIEYGRPALVLLRERALGMRGTIRQRPELTPQHAAELDAARRAGLTAPGSAAAAAEHTGLLTSLQGATSTDERTRVVVAYGPLRASIERALAQISSMLQPSTLAAEVDAIAVVSSTALGIVPEPAGATGMLLTSAGQACVIGPRADRIAERLAEAGLLHEAGTSAHAVDPGTTRGEQLATLIVDWLRNDETLTADEDAVALLDKVAERLVPRAAGDAAGRVPRRSEVLHRGVTPIVAAGLALAQSVIGVPSRMDAEYPTYMADTGVPLTIVPAEVFAMHGTNSAAPGSINNVFVVTGPANGVVEAAGTAAASIEYVDGGSPRAIGVALATACRTSRTMPHVIVITDVQRVAAPRTTRFGMDPELVGTERIATSVLPAGATALVDLDDELLAGPTTIALDTAQTHAVLDPLRELSPATWELERMPAASAGRMGRSRWNLHRRLLRASTGVDL